MLLYLLFNLKTNTYNIKILKGRSKEIIIEIREGLGFFCFVFYIKFKFMKRIY